MFTSFRDAARNRLLRTRTRQYTLPISTPKAPIRKQPQPQHFRDSKANKGKTSAPQAPGSSHSTSRIIFSLFNSFLVLHLLTTYVVTIRGCTGPSMIPTIAWNGDRIVLSKLERYGRDIAVGDLVSYKHPIRQDITALKRVIGMPGDFVLRDTPRETYTLEEEDGREKWMIQVPEGHCWVVGDNLDASRDSRHFGPLPLALIRGKVVARLWPRPAWFKNGMTDVEA